MTKEYHLKEGLEDNHGGKLGSHSIEEGCLPSILDVDHTSNGFKPREFWYW